MPDTVSLPARLTRRSSRPAGTFSVFILAPSARAAERGRWAQAKKGQERVGRAGSLETLGHGCPVLFGSAWLPRLASREIGPVAGSGFLVRRRAWLGCSIRRPIRLRHAIFPAPAWLRASIVFPDLVIVQPNWVKNRVGLGDCTRIYDTPSRPTRFRRSHVSSLDASVRPNCEFLYMRTER